MAEIINVGMGDDESEQKAFLLLYDKQGKIRERLGQLLPEFADAMDEPVHLQPASVWYIWIASYVIYALCAVAAALIGISFFPEQSLIIRIAVTGISISDSAVSNLQEPYSRYFGSRATFDPCKRKLDKAIYFFELR